MVAFAAILAGASSNPNLALAAGLVGARAAHQSEPVAAPMPSEPVAGIAADITAVKVDNRADAAQLAFAIDRPIRPSAFVMANPDRVIVDLPQVDFSLDPRVGVLEHRRHRHAADGLVGSFRFGLFAPGRSRIVIDLAQPARIVGATMRVVDGRSRLVIDLAKTDHAGFLASARGHDTTAFANTATPVAQKPGKATIVVDPGHGGPDTGAMVNGIVEKDVTLAFAKMLVGKLEATGQFNVVMTRNTDVFVPLSERVHVARSAAAALMISIHADKLPESTDVSGATVYTVSDKASDAYAAKVAAQENEADTAVGLDGQADTADVNDILFDLTRQETRAYSHVFARTLVNYWKVAGRLNKNPQRSAGFVVLKAPDVPSVLLELGYLSNPGDSAALTSEEWRGKATTRMTEAIASYFADQHGPDKAAAGVAIPLERAEIGAAAAR